MSFVKNRFISPGLISLGAALLIAGFGTGRVLGQNAFGLFKLNGVEVDCVVPRLADIAFYGQDKVGAKGGEKLTDSEAKQAYDCALPKMRQGYADADLGLSQIYTDWRRFSITPYISEKHGNRYVSNYANKIAAPLYGLYERAPPMPVGAALAKDAFVVNSSGRVVYGGLQLMEKLADGASPETDDWRYTLILPDGRMFGRTGSERANTVKFCHNCHKKQFKTTRNPLHFMPPSYRVR